MNDAIRFYTCAELCAMEFADVGVGRHNCDDYRAEVGAPPLTDDEWYIVQERLSVALSRQHEWRALVRKAITTAIQRESEWTQTAL